MFDLGNQHNNGPDQDQIFDNPQCLALWAKNSDGKGRGGAVGGGGGGGGGGGEEIDAPSRIFMKGVRLLFFLFSVGLTLFKVFYS